jgi:hypothetical protein
VRDRNSGDHIQSLELSTHAATPVAALTCAAFRLHITARAVEWMFCVIQGKMDRWGGRNGGDGQILFTYAPGMLEMGHYSDNRYGFEENDIYPLEVCPPAKLPSLQPAVHKPTLGPWRPR